MRQKLILDYSCNQKTVKNKEYYIIILYEYAFVKAKEYKKEYEVT